MARKLTDAPVKLIHILPSDGGAPTVNPLLPSRRMKLAGIVRRLADRMRGGRERWNGGTRSVMARGSRMLGLVGMQGGRSAAWVRAAAGRASAATCRAVSQTWKTVRPAMAVSWTGAIRGVRAVRPAALGLLRAAHSRSGVRDLANAETAHELHALRCEVAAQQAELQRTTAHLADLRALVMSQQQVLLYMGKEMDALQGQAPPPLPDAESRTTGKKKKAQRAREAAQATGRYGPVQKEARTGMPALSCREATRGR